MIEPELIPAVDELLKGLDPRLPVEERNEALSLALSLHPEFVVGALSQVLMDYHTRAERAAGRPQGFYVDAMRQRMLGGLSEDELLGYAVGSAAAGENVQVRLGHPGSDRWTGGDKRVDTDRVEAVRGPLTNPEIIPVTKYAQPTGPRRPRPGDPDYTVAHAAADAAAQARVRREAELLEGAGVPQSGIAQGQTYPGAPTRAQAEQLIGQPGAPGGGVPPEAQALLNRLQAQRMDEAAIDVGDLDDPAQARAAINASSALDPAQATSDEGNLDLGGPYGTDPIPCGHPTSKGPCQLRRNHPVMPVPGTENGHVGIGD